MREVVKRWLPRLMILALCAGLMSAAFASADPTEEPMEEPAAAEAYDGAEKAVPPQDDIEPPDGVGEDDADDRTDGEDDRSEEDDEDDWSEEDDDWEDDEDDRTDTVGGELEGGLVWTLIDGTLTITGEGPMQDFCRAEDDSIVSAGDAPWRYQGEITRAVIGDGVTSIGGGALRDLSVREVVIPDSVTEIGVCAFQGCGALETVTLPAGVTEIGSDTFSACVSLSYIDLPDGLRSIGPAAFTWCDALTSVELPAGLRSVGQNAFRACAALASVTFAEGLESIGSGAFADCPSLASVELPDSLRSIGYGAFADCGALTSVTLGSGLADLGEGAFGWCGSLSRIDVRGGNPAYASADGVLFTAGQDALVLYPAGRGEEAYAVPDGVTRLLPRSFEGAQALRELTLPDSVTALCEGCLSGCDALAAVRLGRGIAVIEDAVFTDMGLTDLYCAGTAAQFRRVSVGDDNGLLADAVIHYADGTTETGYTPPPPALPEKGNILVSGVCGSRGIPGVTNYEDSWGIGAEWTLDSNGTLTIFGTGSTCLCMEITTTHYASGRPTGMTYIISSPWYEYRDSIRTVVVESGITGIGAMSFRDLTNLRTVFLPDTLEGFGRYAAEKPDTFRNTALHDICFEGTAAQWDELDNVNALGLGSGVKLHFGPFTRAEEPEEPETTGEPEPTEEPEPIAAMRGDCSGDGKVNRQDRVYLARHLAGWAGYETVDEDAADVSGDGKVNRQDRVYLARALAGWEGYTLEL